MLVPVFCVYITAFQIKPEERVLLAQFGEELRLQCRVVPLQVPAAVDADGYDHLFENGIRNEHKKLVIRKTSAIAKNIGDNKKGKCDTISFHHPAQNALYVIDAAKFFNGIKLNYDKRANSWDVGFYTDMALEGKGKRVGCVQWHNTKLLLDEATRIEL